MAARFSSCDHAEYVGLLAGVMTFACSLGCVSIKGGRMQASMASLRFGADLEHSGAQTLQVLQRIRDISEGQLHLSK